MVGHELRCAKLAPALETYPIKLIFNIIELKMTDNTGMTYDFICFTDLAYEFEFCGKKEAETKIKRRLKYYKAGEYSQERVDYIRQLKIDLYSEISQTSKSKYFRKSKSEYSAFEDFNLEQMRTDYNKKYDKLNKNELGRMIIFAIYLYHMR
ncbi:hypothetical protein GCM10011375_15000 [Hymenobacter qilianensis]|uniref:Uncharacterized protein n=2 Tax=Hymenobacter qilianensis TaxID=1385715 RepID=A0ACB5PQ53_9BACT|nr:hypothetical protein [Hymenobacter qilianensis]QNP52994.1 hypothetical protein H9L05_04705 [Hymenobacter qilianensis]GGF60871.1 hypothetical protein GCM10011375_15000 [Hymenobacter qilianensis]